MILERLKFRNYHRIEADPYFWRTYDGSEVDLVKEREGNLFGYEIKWSGRPRLHPPLKWQEYPNSSFHLIDKNKLVDFIL